MVLRPDLEAAVTAVGVERLQAYFVSDVHLNNHTYDRALYEENPSRLNFRKFLTELNDGLLSTDQLLLVLNGDILDITGSWYELPLPWEDSHKEVEVRLHEVIDEILENNRHIFDEIRRMLAHPTAEIIYVIGNHDGLFELFPSAQERLISALLPPDVSRERLRFELSVEIAELDMYVEHGHRLDPYNVYDPKQNPPLGDVINVLIVNRFVENTVDRLHEHHYPDEFIEDLRTHLHDIEYLRPLALFPLWIETVATRMSSHPHIKSQNRGNADSLLCILQGVILDILQDPGMTRYLVERLHLPRTFLKMLVRLFVTFPGILPVVSFIVSKLVRRTHSNKFQYRMAQRLHNERHYKLITFGHTHIPGLQALSHDGYFFNTGSWKPVINLFKYSDNNPAHLEYLSAEERFKKVQRCGILKIEKDLTRPDSAPEFALQTVQSGN